MQLLVTRPQAQAAPAVRELRALGVDAVALPLIGIEAVAGEPGSPPTELARAWASLAACRLVMFVSANAVAHFFAAAPAGAAWPAGTLAGSTGPGTTAALRAAQVPPGCIREPAPESAALDSEALWAQLRPHDWAGARVLVVRGEGGRDWLGDTLRGAGAMVSFVAAYRRTLPVWTAEQRERMAAVERGPQHFAWQISSSEGVRNLLALSPALHWRASPAFATHPRIGQAARDAGFKWVRVIAPGAAAQAQAWHDRTQGDEAAGPGGPSIQSRPL
ncbi:MAG: uroporphyrinogen-III synthase [Rubrivivax sp.]|nr:uroporphyrinogen-III synthase [Rubrivivax sp.]